ncbi:hypothetical protein [Herpetosiphon giganteus]|uniref:hypothetical protein n=1 Tax=Herpetosiphon giganteus TaxID=2029754 RepID=UPI0019582203|nr:hypothetical protein [Herpetosiphon giganteus]MBM7846437.1 hypothetical protein [Herpetosiphon giganteus]
MGFETNTIRFLLEARSTGVQFKQSLTLGRQGMHLGVYDLQQVFAQVGETLPLIVAQTLTRDAVDGEPMFAEPLLHYLGASSADSIDFSDYESATILQDLNQPIPAELHGRFSSVIDGGTLEHIFNLPIALQNSLNMVAEGGHFLAITPCNNMAGHGFYQFSPELFWRILTPENGYQLEKMYVFEMYPHAPWYRVHDPKAVGGRVTLQNRRPAFLLVQAKRISATPIERLKVQQSDYVSVWQAGTGSRRPSLVSRLTTPLRRRLPTSLKMGLRKISFRLKDGLTLLRSPYRAKYYDRYK